MPTDHPSSPAETRLFTDHLMIELGLALVEHGRITREQIDELTVRCALTGDRLDTLLVKDHFVSEKEVLDTLSALTHIPHRGVADFHITQEEVSRLPPKVALNYHLIPLQYKGSVITLGASQVPTQAVSDNLRMMLNLAVDWVLCSENDVARTLQHFYGLGAETVDSISDAAMGEEIEILETNVTKGMDAADAGMIRFVNQIISEAILRNATDIHLEPFETHLRLRYRIDGILHDIPLPKGIQKFRKAVASCVKIMAELDIAERRKPHDGRIKVRSGSEEFDLRVSILPTRYGETVNMRILNRKAMFFDLQHLGLGDDQRPTIEALSALPHGVILITGPTGSGKTTTLYATLSRVNTPAVKIITVEDPIEYQMEGINQIQVHPKIGLTFATILRSILRHDPDIVLIGEIRDSETADIAVRASLTGHLVFSTLHTNDAPSAITRLSDMGVEPYLVSSCLEGVIAQRLVRRICPACKESMVPDESVLEEIRLTMPGALEGAQFCKGRGCPECNFTGYRGRLAIFEIMVLNDSLRSMIVKQRPSNEIRQQAEADGFVTLRKDAWKCTLRGDTTIEEVMRVTRRAEMPHH
ncbi:MAG: ATPase, T2SS/T4P/T4SS family [bacterium]|jgi:type II secretory ATPase GspE/PulE/Tfp pilus assembly ATPase PilB-like protein